MTTSTPAICSSRIAFFCRSRNARSSGVTAARSVATRAASFSERLTSAELLNRRLRIEADGRA